MTFEQACQFYSGADLLMSDINNSLDRAHVQDTLDHLEKFVAETESLPFGRYLTFTSTKNFHSVFSTLEGEQLAKATELFDRLFKSISEIVFRGKHMNAYIMPRNICVQFIGTGIDESATFSKEDQNLATVLKTIEVLALEDE